VAYQARFPTLISRLRQIAALPSQKNPEKSLRMRQINSFAKAAGASVNAFHGRQPIYCTKLGQLLLLYGYQCERPAPLSGAPDSAGAGIF
jgi:hypothetical protein